LITGPLRLFYYYKRGRRDRMVVGNTSTVVPMQLAPITTKDVSSNFTHDVVESIQ